MTRARAELRQVIKILPRRALYHYNLALYSSYGGDPKSGQEEAKVAQQLGSAYALGALAFAQTVQGQLPQAVSTYQQLGMADDTVAKSWSASGLGDLAAYGGRFSNAVRVLEQGAAADVKGKSVDRAAAKFAAIAHVRLQQGQTAAAVAAADNAPRIATRSRSGSSQHAYLPRPVKSPSPSAGRQPCARQFRQPQALAKIIEGNIALISKNPQLDRC
jgi:hypothetical protein